LKVEQMPLYHEVGSPSNYEEDHFIPLELGGAPKNPKNLWPEPHTRVPTLSPSSAVIVTGCEPSYQHVFGNEEGVGHLQRAEDEPRGDLDT
jgi:hypothetical protein